MGFGLPGLGGGHVVVAALVVATNLAPMAGLDGLAAYTGAAACALADPVMTRSLRCSACGFVMRCVLSHRTRLT